MQTNYILQNNLGCIPAYDANHTSTHMYANPYLHIQTNVTLRVSREITQVYTGHFVFGQCHTQIVRASMSHDIYLLSPDHIHWMTYLCIQPEQRSYCFYSPTQVSGNPSHSDDQTVCFCCWPALARG